MNNNSNDIPADTLSNMMPNNIVQNTQLFGQQLAALVNKAFCDGVPMYMVIGIMDHIKTDIIVSNNPMVNVVNDVITKVNSLGETLNGITGAEREARA